MKDFKCLLIVCISFCCLMWLVSMAWSAEELKQKSAEATHPQSDSEADLALTDIYISDDCRVSVKVTNVGEVAVLNMYSLVATTINGKSQWQARMPVNLAPKASKDFPVPGCSLVGIDTIKIEIFSDPMRSIQLDHNTADKMAIKTLTCHDVKCPSGFSPATISSKSDFKCARQKPARPCPQGYHVIWGPCTPEGGDNLTVSPQCSFTCVPENPNVKYDCGTNQSISTSCYAGCSKNYDDR